MKDLSIIRKDQSPSPYHDPIRVRAHTLLCLQGFRGEGYSAGFVENMAAIHSRVDNVQLRPDSWAALLRGWRIPSSGLIDRDRVER